MLPKSAISSFFVGSAFEIKTHKILFFKGGTVKWKFVIVVARFQNEKLGNVDSIQNKKIIKIGNIILDFILRPY